MSYKILRAQCLRDLFYDTAKHVKRKNTDELEMHTNVIEIIKNGWVNLSRAADFSNINADCTLLTAAEEGWNVAGVNMLIKDLGADIEVVNPNGATPLCLACKEGRCDVTRFLIQAGSNIEHQNDIGWTPLIFAAYWGMEGTCEILLSAGAHKKDAIYFALRNFQSTGTFKHKRIVSMLKGESVGPTTETENNDSKLNELTNAAIAGSLASFLDVHDVSQSLISQFLPSQTAVASLENLLQTLWFGADVKQRGSSSFSSLHFAAKFGTQATVSTLLEAGASVNVQTCNGRLPLYYAAGYGTPAMVRVLLQARASVNTRDKDGWTPLYYAVRLGVLENVKLLLEAKVDANARTGDLTPLLTAARLRDAAMVAELLKFGADINVDNGRVFKEARFNEMDKENILTVLREHRRV